VVSPRPGLKTLVSARRVAVIGASDEPNRIGGRPIDFLRRSGFDGRIYPVNPRRALVQGLPCYPAVRDIPDQIDVAIIAVPADQVAAAVREVAAKGGRGAIVYSSGFAEMGRAGARLQEELTRVAREVGVRVIGPNCQGLAAFHQRLNLSFSSALVDAGEAGSVALIAQSGAVGGMLHALLRERGVCFSHWISSGNEADVTLAECVEFLAEDPHTRVIGAYVEGIRDGRRLLAAVGNARAAGKPVVLLRAGRSPQAARAARSHTGAIAAEERVAQALLRDAGATDAADVHELVDCIDLVARRAVPGGPRIALLSNSGGLGVLMSDSAADLGLEVPPFPDDVREELGAVLPPFGATGNPVDVTAQMLADHTLLRRSLEVMLRAPGIDVVIVALTMVTRLYPVDQIVDDVIRVSREASRPVLACWVAAEASGVDRLRAGDVPTFTDPTRCMRAIAALVQLIPTRELDEPAGDLAEPGRPARDLAEPHEPAGDLAGDVPVEQEQVRPQIADDSAPARAARAWLARAGGRAADEYVSKAALRQYGMPTVVERLERTAAAAAAAAEAIGFPVAVKICSAAIAHKSDHGLVRLSLADRAQVLEACAALEAALQRAFPEPPGHAWLVQRMAPPGGLEVVLGARRDPVFGPIVMVGLGGVFVEYFQDVAFALAPLGRRRALGLLRSLRAAPLFRGARGRPPADEDAVADALVALGRFAVDLEDQVAEVDVNPLIALPRGQGALAVDALVVLDAGTPASPAG
jgi:acyl-CoA synthetase (NDP forming)